jgi:ATP-dependent Clp protease ATP-binding subunit ClpB
LTIDLNKLSDDLEGALERARMLAEQRQQAFISPAHILYVLLDSDSSLAAILERAGVARGALLDGFASQFNGHGKQQQLEPGKRPVASQALRNLIEKSFGKMEARGAERVSPIDLVLAAIDFSEEDLKGELRQAGVTSNAIEKVLEARESTSAALDQPAGASKHTSPVNTSRILERFGQDLTALAAAGELMPVIGRDDEIRRVIQTLLRKSKNNPALVGDPGTGKTAIAEALAQRIVAGDVPESLKKCRVVALDLTAMVAGAKYRGEFEERIKSVVDEVRSRKGEIILFLDELHAVVGAGGTEGGMDAANILKPALARGELRCVGATTYDEYREHIEKDGALARRFDVVQVQEPSDETMMVILRGVRTRYETFHGVRLSDEALQAAVKLSRRYLRSRFFPDKALDVIDEATARIRMQKESKPMEIDQQERLLVRKQAELEALRSSTAALTPQRSKIMAALEAEIAELKPKVEGLAQAWLEQKATSESLQKTKQTIEEQASLLQTAEAKGDIAVAAGIRYGSLKYLEEQRCDLEQQLARMDTRGLVPDTVLPEHIAEIVAEHSGLPTTRMLESERDRLLKMEERIKERVFGQDEAVHAVSEAARRMRADLQPGRKPNSFLFVGPTGVGKTELAKALADALFDDDNALIRIDLGEYTDKSSVSGLIGSRPGLVGSDEGGFLTEQVRRFPYSVVLFDEVEKGHPEILNLLLGVLDEGRLTDAKGRFCDFSNTIVLFTSNLGVREAIDCTDDVERRKEIILEVVKARLRPELYNRIGQILTFNSLTSAELERVIMLQLDALRRKLAEEREIELSVADETIAWLAKESYDPAYGARPVHRTLQRLVLAPLALAILAGEVVPGQRLRMEYLAGEGLAFHSEGAVAVAS